MLLVDEDEHFLRPFAHALEERGIRVSTARTFDIANKILATGTPSHVISELRVAGQWLADRLNEIVAACPVTKLGIVTAYPSVATAVQFARLGVAAYLAKPVSSQALLEELRRGSCPGAAVSAPSEPPVWPTLDRAIWEYVYQVFVSAGSVSEAARRLGIHRHSLRRMLAKHPPACRADAASLRMESGGSK